MKGALLSDWCPPARREPAGRCLGWLQDASLAFEQARADLDEAVKASRAAGWSWQSIAEATCLDIDVLRRRYGPGRRRTLEV